MKSGLINNVIIFYNKQPKWDTAAESFMLNFNGRVKKPSTKNFQIVDNFESIYFLGDYIYLQFGKFDKDVFSLDACYPFSVFQAFAVSISALDSKFSRL